MRLLALELQRYGHLSDAVLDFPAVPLCIVQGPNEAGKSTALSAIGDALFGIPERSRHAFLHPAAQLRLRFALSAADGATMRFSRRKGRGQTLLDAEGEPLPEEALARFLGWIGRDAFERSFGLNGDRLREGGTALAQLGGGVGETLFAAGTGLIGLRAALDRIDEEAKSLFGDGRGKRRIPMALDRYMTSRREVEDRAVAPRSWQEADAAHRAAVAALAELRQRAAALDAEANRLQRVRRIRPILAQLDATLVVIADTADGPALPPDIGEKLQALTDGRVQAARDRERAAQEATRLMRDRDALVRAPTVLAAQDAIDDLQARLVHIGKAEADLPARRQEMAAISSAVAGAVASLGLSLAPEDARDAVPPPKARDGVQSLLIQHGTLVANHATAQRNLEEAKARLHEAETALGALSAPPDPTLLRSAINAVRGEGKLDQELAAAEQDLATACQALSEALAALPLWTGDAEALAALPVPLPAARTEAASRMAEAEKRRREAVAAIEDLDEQIVACRAQLVRLEQGEVVPTREAVGVARAERDRAWMQVRDVLERSAGAAVQPVEPNLPSVFETLRDEADRLADRRADDFQRVADYLAARTQRDALVERRTMAEAQKAEAERESGMASSDWAGLWAPAGISPASPEAMTEWLRQRDKVLERAQHAAAALRKRNDLARRHDAACALLRPFLLHYEGEAGLAPLLLRADHACSAAETARQIYEKTSDAVRREAGSIPRVEEKLGTAAEELAAWQSEWSEAIGALRLPPDATPETVTSALRDWTLIAEKAPQWRDLDQRVADMTQAIDAFAADVRAALAMTGGDAAEHASVAARRLIRELAEARKAEQTAENLAGQISEQQRQAQDADRRIATIDTDLAALRELADVADDSALAEAIERSHRLAAARVATAPHRNELAAQGDGLSETALRDEEANASDADGLTARLSAIEQERAEVNAERERLTAECTRREDELAAMARGHDAAAAAQEARHALADAGEAADRYARLHVARTLLRAGIERYRKTQQGPLLRAAGAHFAALTAGRYERLIAEEDGGKAVILAVRDNGTECPLDALSDGARDQLYLALRVAIVEAHAATTEPLPFIADDLLVQFDDTRAAAALRLLARLGRTTQVILFTHHTHILDLAAEHGATVVAIRHFGEQGAERALVAG